MNFFMAISHPCRIWTDPIIATSGTESTSIAKFDTKSWKAGLSFGRVDAHLPPRRGVSRPSHHRRSLLVAAVAGTRGDDYNAPFQEERL
jgi:hypothetical protein